MTLKELLDALEPVDKKDLKMKVMINFEAANRWDLKFLSMYSVGNVIMIDIGEESE